MQSENRTINPQEYRLCVCVYFSDCHITVNWIVHSYFRLLFFCWLLIVLNIWIVYTLHVSYAFQLLFPILWALQKYCFSPKVSPFSVFSLLLLRSLCHDLMVNTNKSKWHQKLETRRLTKLKTYIEYVLFCFKYESFEILNAAFIRCFLFQTHILHDVNTG